MLFFLWDDWVARDCCSLMWRGLRPIVLFGLSEDRHSESAGESYRKEGPFQLPSKIINSKSRM